MDRFTCMTIFGNVLVFCWRDTGRPVGPRWQRWLADELFRIAEARRMREAV